jgi:DNA-binding MarR family transcriptional regulator
MRRGGNDGDRRKMSLNLTARGRAVLEKARRGTQRRMEEAIQVLSDQQRKDVLTAMGILRDVFGPLDSRR